MIQYSVCPQLALTTVVQRLHMNRIRFWISCKGIASHSWRKSSSSWSVFWGSRRLTRRSSTSHKFSIGEISGENTGHGNTLTCCSSRYLIDTRSVCHLALSCWNSVTFMLALKNGTTTYAKYLCPVKLPWARISSERTWNDIPYHHSWTSKMASFEYTSIAITFTTSTEASHAPVWAVQAESWFITK